MLKQYGDCEGPVGIPMRSAAAKELEVLLGTVSADCRAAGLMRVVKNASMEFADDERADISLVTTDSIDRDGEVMLVNGGDFTQFKRNPTVTFAHKYDMLPAGRCMWLKKDDRNGRKGWLAKTQYISKPADWSAGVAWFPDAVWHYVRTGNLPGKSIGFVPLEMRPPDEKEVKARPELANVRRIIPKWLALEYAVCPIPCNPDALVQATAKARQKGIIVPDILLEEFGMIVPEPSYETPATAPTPTAVLTRSQVQAQVGESIQKAMRNLDIKQMIQDNLDKLRGRV
jgi:hypothetical protein